jgi:hypothetical protein
MTDVSARVDGHLPSSPVSMLPPAMPAAIFSLRGTNDVIPKYQDSWPGAGALEVSILLAALSE